MDQGINIKSEPREVEDGEIPINIKNEPCPENDPIPNNFFDDLLEENVKPEPIPNNFFDDLLDNDKPEDVEIKYADQLRTLNRNQNEDASGSRSESPKERRRDSKHKKNKHKGKKRKRKRSRNGDEIFSPPHDNNIYGENDQSRSPPTNHNSIQINNSFSIPGFKRIKLERRSDQTATVETKNESSNEKRINANSLALEMISALKNWEKSQHMKRFIFTSVVMKEKSEEELENRSPLNMINNVAYNFNSITSKLNLSNWNLAKLSKNTAKVAKIIGIDAEELHNKIAKSKFAQKFRKIQDENMSKEHIKSSFFTNATTQTEDMQCQKCQNRGRTRGYDISVQATPHNFDISTQTSKTNQDLPLMKLIDVLNSNQLLALNDFAELMCQPGSNTTIDLYEKRKLLWTIYEMSQAPIPSTSAHGRQHYFQPPQNNMHNQYFPRSNHSNISYNQMPQSPSWPRHR